jgi:plastocyanin
MMFESSSRRRSMTRWSVTLGLAGLVAGARMNERKPTTHTVTIDASQFEPAESTVSVGDTVIWINRDIIPHTATSRAGRFDSGAIAPGKSWTYLAARRGKFAYICTFHPTMKAVLRVK